MHKDDLMTPKERAAALKNGKRVDRMPIGMHYGMPAANLLRWSRRYGDSMPRRHADCIKKVYEVFGIDGIGTSYSLHGVGIAYGAKVSDPEFAAPAILEYPVKEIAAIGKLDLSVLTIQKDHHAKSCLETVQILTDELRDEVSCQICLPGPFTSVSSLIGPENLLYALTQNPEALHEAMGFVTSGLLQLAQAFLEVEIPVNVADPMASGSVISKKHFDNVVAPYAKRFVDACNSIRPFGVSCHICGDTTKILESIAACGYNNVDIDHLVDLECAKNHIGKAVHISGNINPMGALFSGTPAQVEEEVRASFRKAWNSPGGFTISTGCDSAWGTPLENSLAFVKEARKCASYPLGPQNFLKS